MQMKKEIEEYHITSFTANMQLSDQNVPNSTL